jgi:hypothetical protein
MRASPDRLSRITAGFPRAHVANQMQGGGHLRCKVTLEVVKSQARKARNYCVWPRSLLMPRTESSDFARNPAAGLSSISSL